MNNFKSKRIETLLIIGLGSIGRKHVKILKSLRPDIRIVALTSRASLFEHDPNFFSVVDNLDDAIALSPDAAIVCNPASHHIRVSVPLLLKSVPLLIEKPITDLSKKAVELVEAAFAKNTFVTVGYNLRFLESLIYFKELIHDNAVGKIYSVKASVGQNLTTWRPNQNYKESVSSQKKLGGGVLLELSHEIDYLMWIFGSVYSVSGYFEKVSDLDIDVEDISHALIRFNKTSLHDNLVANLSMDFIRKDPTRYCEVIGHEGTLIWDGIKGIVRIFKNGKWKVLFEDTNPSDFSYEKELNHFIDCIENAKAPLVNLESSINVLRVIEAIKSSSEKKKVITIK